jgi:lysozyme
MNALDRQIARLNSRGYQWPVPWEVVEMMGRKENCKLVSYLCPAKVWTIGWGETEGVAEGMVWTEEQADLRFFQEVCRYTDRVRAMLTEPANPNELGAMVSLSYNIGLGGPGVKGGFFSSTVRRLHNAGDRAGAARAFRLFNKARVNGVLTELRGLTTRRAVEAAMYLTPVEGEDLAEVVEETMPQEIEPESSMAKSPINVTAVGVIGAGVVKAATETSDALQPLVLQASTYATALNLNPGLILGGLLVLAGGVSLYWRFKQRQGGWA